jgi:hypothetical protein
MSLFMTLSPGCATSLGGAGTMTFAKERRRPEADHFLVKDLSQCLRLGISGSGTTQMAELQGASIELALQGYEHFAMRSSSSAPPPPISGTISPAT